MLEVENMTVSELREYARRLSADKDSLYDSLHTTALQLVRAENQIRELRSERDQMLITYRGYHQKCKELLQAIEELRG